MVRRQQQARPQRRQTRARAAEAGAPPNEDDSEEESAPPTPAAEPAAEPVAVAAQAVRVTHLHFCTDPHSDSCLFFLLLRDQDQEAEAEADAPSTPQRRASLDTAEQTVVRRDQAVRHCVWHLFGICLAFYWDALTFLAFFHQSSHPCSTSRRGQGPPWPSPGHRRRYGALHVIELVSSRAIWRVA